jgi:hypothetical protein
MKLRTIILTISLLALLSTLAGGYFYYAALKNATIDKMETQTAFDARLIRNHLENKMAVFIVRKQPKISIRSKHHFG